MLKNKYIAIVLLLTSVVSHAKDIILEVKGAGFIPSNKIYKKIYGNSGIFGLEGTFNLGCDYLYGFISLDFVHKKGKSIGLCNPTKINLFELGLGLKCLVPFCDAGDAYFGLGILPTHVKTNDCSPFVIPVNKKWTVGGIAKFGVLFNIGCNFILDLFVDYAFVRARFCCSQSKTGFVEPRTAHLNATIIGGGLGYRFN